MKLQNLSVIFIVITLPIILLVSYYISLQIDTINMQTSYNTKLLESTKEAIEAFEINTVEWNESYSEVADSKRRDIMASINTFTTSFANNLGIGGTNKENILTYIPAIAYTLYDGYYIYSPATTAKYLTNEEETAVVLTEKLVKSGKRSDAPIDNYTFKEEDVGKVLYRCDKDKTRDGTYNGTDFTFNMDNAETENKHILKPFTSYSARYQTSGGTDVTINYTLDNYFKVFGNVRGKYETKQGYFIETSEVSVPDNSIKGIKSETGKEILPEKLTEQVTYNYNGIIIKKQHRYVYETGKTKVYFDDDNTAFQISSNGNRTNLSDSTVLCKKLTIRNGSGHIEIYQALASKGEIIQGQWYRNGVLTDENKIEDIETVCGKKIELEEDVSAINYYVESYLFSEWVNTNLSSLKAEDLKVSDRENFTITGKIFENPNDEESVFNLHKREVIKQALISNLNQAITSYSRNSAGEYQLPVLSETDWDQILTNVSITTFVQGIPIGMKQYNNYAIATSTNNKEYVDPDEIYLYEQGDTKYHLPYCEKLEASSNLIGYRSIDYSLKTKNFRLNETTTQTDRYYLHDNDDDSYHQQICYYCLVQRSLYSQNKTDKKATAYEIALARERYVARSITIQNSISGGGETPSVGDIEPIEYYTLKVTVIDKMNQGQITNVDEPIEIAMRNKKEILGFTSMTGGSRSTLINIKDKSNSDITLTVNGTPNYGYNSINDKQIDIIKDGGVQNGNYEDYEIRTDSKTIDIKIKFQPKVIISENNIDLTSKINSNNVLELEASLNNLTINTDEEIKVGLEFFLPGNNFDNAIVNKVEGQVTNENKTIIKGVTGTEWYKKEWYVKGISIYAGGEDITSYLQNSNYFTGDSYYVKHYKIGDSAGLKGFSDAINEGAESYFESDQEGYDKEGNRVITERHQRKFYLTSNIDYGNQTIVSIGKEEQQFEGEFGCMNERYTINNIKIDVTDKSRTDYGLFGRVGSNGKINKFNIDNIIVDLSDVNTNTGKTYYTAGAIAGYSKGEISEVTVTNANVEGFTYNGTSNTNNDVYVCIGGVSGVTTATIKDVEISNTTVTNKITPPEEKGFFESWFKIKDGKVYIGTGGVSGRAERKEKH